MALVSWVGSGWGRGFGYLDWGSGQAVKALKVTEQDIIKDKQIKLC